MDCTRVEEMLGSYLDGMLDERDVSLVEAHLAKCENCRKELSTLKMLVEAAGRTEEMEPPIELRESIYAATTGRKKIAHPVLNGFNLREWFRTGVSPVGMRWASGALAAGIIALAIMIGTPQKPTTVRQATVKQSEPAPVMIPVIPSQSNETVAESAADEPVELDQSSVKKTPRYHAVNHSHSVKGTSKLARSVKPKPAPKLQQKETAVAAQVEKVDKLIAAQPEIDVDATSIEEKEVEVAVVHPAPTAIEAEQEKPVMVEVASAPIIDHQKIDEWMRDAKNQAKMRKVRRGGPAVSVVRATF